MKDIRSIALPLLLCALLGSSGCQRGADDVWNDTKTASRHLSRGVGSVGGKNGSSQQLLDEGSAASYSAGSVEETANTFRVTDEESIPAPRESPGDPGSAIPGIEAFSDPAQNPELAAVFSHIHFDTNSPLIKGEDNLNTLHKIVAYMKSHPRLHIFVEGHCDKRGSASYNFALGANRAQSVRTTLVQDGISPDRIFTISYGKERPLFEESGEEFFKQNRRAQFKTYER